MKTSMILGVTAVAVAMAMATVACSGADAPTEKTSQTEDHYDVNCVQSIQAPAGSPAWREQLQSCIGSYGGGGGAPATTPAPGAGGAGGGQSCSISTSCINGSCTCGSGPNKGQACDGALPSGATSCSDLCRHCQ
jgi:hypothetical protein